MAGDGGPLVTLDEAKRHLYQEWTTDNDADIQAKLEQASAIIRDYLTKRNDETWDPTTVPLPIKSAVLLMLDHLWEDRGGDASRDEDVWAAIHRLVIRFRDPAWA
jgi:hypothetical protein